MNTTTNPDAAAVAAVVVRYVETVRSNTTADYNATQAVIDAAADESGDRIEVVYEMLETAGTLGYDDGAEDDAERDAWWDAMCDALPAVVAALRGPA
jgi:hypothetical protein